MTARDLFKRIYKVTMIAATVGLAMLAYLAYRASTPGTGDVLLSIILAILAFFALLSIPKLDWQDQEAATYRGILDDMRARFRVREVRGRGRGPPGEAGLTGTIEWSAGAGQSTSVHFAEPEVHRVDRDALDKAKHMAAQGTPIDDICRMIDPGHDRHDSMHQEVFRRMVQAMIDQG